MCFDQTYFSTNTYQNVSFAKYSQYWWSNRFYGILARRYGKGGGTLLEIGSGLGHLVGQLENDFSTVAVEINPWALEQSRDTAMRTRHVISSAEELPFRDGAFGSVIIKHVVEHLPHPERAIDEIGRITHERGTLILSTPNLGSLLKPWKGNGWIGYQDPTHISLKPPEEWFEIIRCAGFGIQRVFADGFWDVPYIRIVPKIIQKILFGSLGGLQAISGTVFLPMRWGESIIVIARKSTADNDA